MNSASESAAPPRPSHADPSSATWPDWVLAALLVIITAVFVWVHVNHPMRPMEDASMLLRYAQHLGQGHGIVWNVGEPPVEGATDFLYMVLIGALSRVLHAGVERVAETILFCSHLISVGVLYFALRRFHHATRLLAAGFALMLGLGLGYHFVNTGFSAPFYSLFALLTWVSGLVCLERGVTWRRALLFSALAFTTGLIRPDGVILACLMLLSILFGLKTRRLPLILSFGSLFAVFGGLYFAWRVQYFGYPFPNPFYVKSAAGPSFGILKLSWRNLTEMLLLSLPFAGFAVRNRESVRRLSVWLITLVPFTCVWMIISNDNNHFSRFQYVLVPLSLLELGGFAATWWLELKFNRPADAAFLQRPVACVFLVLVATGVFYNMHLYLAPFSNVGGEQLAQRLRPYAAKGYTLLTTEAGDIPFYSQWRTVDLLGLNDATIAHHGGLIPPEYLDRIKPEVILYHDFPWRMHLADIGKTEHKDALTPNALVARDYARKNGYILAAQWGASPCELHTFWVKPDFADSAAIVSAIRDHPYYTQGTGDLSFDFRNTPPPAAPCWVDHQ